MIKEIKFVGLRIQGKEKKNDFTINFENNNKIIITGDNGIGKTSLINMMIGILENDNSWYSYIEYKKITFKFNDIEKVIENHEDVKVLKDINKEDFLNEHRAINDLILLLKNNSYHFKEFENEINNILSDDGEFQKLWKLLDNILKTQSISISDNVIKINSSDYSLSSFINYIKSNVINLINNVNSKKRAKNNKQSRIIQEINEIMRNKYEYFSIFRNAKNYFNLSSPNMKYHINEKYSTIIKYETRKKSLTSRINDFGISLQNSLSSFKQGLFNKIIYNEKNTKNFDSNKLLEYVEKLINCTNDEEINQLYSSLKNNTFMETFGPYFWNIQNENSEKIIDFSKKIDNFSEKISELLHNKKIEYKNWNFFVKEGDKETLLSDYAFSAGESQMVDMLSSLLLSEKEIIIIDEPEISLSIKWQRILRDAIDEFAKKNKIIFITHSPFLITKNDLENNCVEKFGNNE